ncbi:sulfide/dihydroorotate dehydrogenase-like FAD/NAD-binding protein [bacterium]|nr:sulfide/dihydroorotate dehydrogenase-like FAD/NAD-binding protein [bacterium]
MNRILQARPMAPGVTYYRIDAPKIAKKRRPGQFVILRPTADGERIPITIADSDPDEGWIALIIQAIGKTTSLLATLGEGDSIADMAGPLGLASEIEHYGTAVTIGGGVGAAIAYPITVALREAGNEVIAIVGGRSREYVILEDELNAVADEVYPCTDDGSYGFHGFVTQQLQALIDEGRSLDYVLAVGPIPMMRAVAEVTRPYGIKTVVSLNPIMVDGTGMCGGCRVTIGGETRFACVDGPEFDAHEVDFEVLQRRNASYGWWEEWRMEQFEEACRSGANS